MQYLALLRGINVGGKSLIAMADLRSTLTDAGLINVRTYIQSGNVLFESALNDQYALAGLVHDSIAKRFSLDVAVVVFSKYEWERVITSAPSWWGADSAWKHNILVMIPPFDMPAVVSAIGELKPDIEAMEAGTGVLYQSLSWDAFGRTTGGKIASKLIYKHMTIRNFNTATKLLTLFQDE
jgi:uncharacterized protein (DUF1697 family)